ncbi:MAG: hypothetical protein ABW328_00485 [Ilumatobacteraceae bacterium]
MTVVLVIVGVIVALVLIAVVVAAVRRRRTPDGVATFQRQIDALSPEARRPVVDQVQQLEQEDED